MDTNKEFEIKFGKSSSNNYQTALSIAKKFSEFNSISEHSNFNIIRADSEEISKKYKIFENLFRNEFVYYDEHQVDLFLFILSVFPALC